MRYTTIPTSKGRKDLPRIIREVDEEGLIYVFTIHGKAKAALIDLDLLEEFIENTEFGISNKEILRRSQEETISLEELKKKINL